MVYLGKIQASLLQNFCFFGKVHEILVSAMFFQARKNKGFNFTLIDI
jgi:hypothetical protein